jgi:hypothetical protein
MRKNKTPPTPQDKIVEALRTMPAEAFSWLVITMAHLPNGQQIWPDGLGGFNPESRKSIESVMKLSNEYLSQ